VTFGSPAKGGAAGAGASEGGGGPLFDLLICEPRPARGRILKEGWRIVGPPELGARRLDPGLAACDQAPRAPCRSKVFSELDHYVLRMVAADLEVKRLT
jgi:hypothetical protein